MDKRTFFEAVHPPTFYEAIQHGHGLADAIRAAVRSAAGWKVEAVEETIRVRLRDPEGRTVEFRLRAGDVPRAWGWWTPPAQRKGWTLIWDGEVIEGPPLSDDEVFCDLCGSWVPVRPVPVVLGGYALCEECFRFVLGVSVQEAAAWDGVTLSTIE